MNDHPLGRVGLDQVEGLFWGSRQPCGIVLRREDRGHPVGVCFLGQRIRRRRDHRRGDHLSKVTATVIALVSTPDARQSKRWPYLVSGDAEPDVGRRIAARRLAEAGGGDQATALDEARLPERGRPKLVVPRVVHGLRLDRLAGLLRDLRHDEPPVRRLQPPRPVVIHSDDRGQAFGKDRRQRFGIAERVVGRIDRKELTHRIGGHRVGVEVAHAEDVGRLTALLPAKLNTTARLR